VAEALGESRDVGALLRQDERDARSAATGAAGAADAMDVVVLGARRVEVDDVRDRVDVKAAGGHVGRDERGTLPVSNCASERSRAPCDMFPCITAARTSYSRASFLARRSAPCFVRTKTSESPPASPTVAARRPSFVSGVTGSNRWSISPCAGPAAGSTRRCTGLTV
jgi:hypothetical protein